MKAEQLVLEPSLRGSATVSPCGTYRYLLSRRWHFERPTMILDRWREWRAANGIERDLRLSDEHHAGFRRWLEGP